MHCHLNVSLTTNRDGFSGLTTFYLQCGATYIRGRADIFFYEYIYDLCGDGTLPYMVYFSSKINAMHFQLAFTNWHNTNSPEYLEKLTQRVQRRQQLRLTPTISVHITAKLVLRTIPPLETKISTFTEVFPERVVPGSRKIGFKFAGCCPVTLKSKYKSLGGQQHQQRQTPTPVAQLFHAPAGVFHKSVVICKRKLLKPLTNATPVWRVSDLRRMIIWINLKTNTKANPIISKL